MGVRVIIATSTYRLINRDSISYARNILGRLNRLYDASIDCGSIALTGAYVV